MTEHHGLIPDRTEPEPKPPYFNFQMRQFLIEGSHSIAPSTPVEVGGVRQLLMDDYVVDDAWACHRTVHQPEKYPGNPVLPCPDNQVAKTSQGTVMYDEQLKRFRLWASYWYKWREKYAPNIVTNYYESEDGINWVAPELGIVEFDGSRANNVILGAPGFICGGPSVVEAPPRLRARGRYAMLHGRAGGPDRPGQHHKMDTLIAWSKDGLHWQDQAENPVLHGRTDTFNNMVYNPERDVFMHYRRATVNANQIRRMAYSESTDLITFTQPQVIIYPDELDPCMFYGMPVTKYQGVYLGFLEMFYVYMDQTQVNHVLGPKSHQIDIQLAWSRDGIHWQRHPKRPIFLPTGVPDSYDWGMIQVLQGLPERDDRVLVYYVGDEAFHTNASVQNSKTGHLCLATLRQDGFVSLDAPAEGYMLTRPLRCPGGKLHINARTTGNGFVRVAARRGDGVNDGDWIEGWSFDDGPVFAGDSTDAALDWKSAKSFDGLKGDAMRLHFWMQKAELYSFWFA